MFKVANAVENVDRELNKQNLSSLTNLLDLVYPNHDGIKDIDAVSDCMILRQSLEKVANLCNLWVTNLTDAIGDKLELDIISLGLPYFSNDDGSFDVKYIDDNNGFFMRGDLHNVISIREDVAAYYFDLNTGLGDSEYNKGDWDFKSAFLDVITE